MLDSEITSLLLLLLYKRYYNPRNYYTIQEIMNEPCFSLENKDHVIGDIQAIRENGFVIDYPRLKKLRRTAYDSIDLQQRIRISVEGMDEIRRLIDINKAIRKLVLSLGDMSILETVTILEEENNFMNFRR